MRKTVMAMFVIAAGVSNGFGQAINPMKELASSVCDCFTKKDLKAIKTESEAKSAFMSCFLNDTQAIMKVLDERKIDITNHKAMESLGLELAAELLRQNCSPMTELSLFLAKVSGSKGTDTINAKVTNGRLTRIETKEFLYFVITDSGNREHSFIWLHYFQGSEKFIKDPASYIGKSMQIRWQETEVFIPTVKDYFKIKEITGIDFE